MILKTVLMYPNARVDGAGNGANTPQSIRDKLTAAGYKESAAFPEGATDFKVENGIFTFTTPNGDVKRDSSGVDPNNPTGSENANQDRTGGASGSSGASGASGSGTTGGTGGSKSSGSSSGSAWGYGFSQNTSGDINWSGINAGYDIDPNKFMAASFNLSSILNLGSMVPFGLGSFFSMGALQGVMQQFMNAITFNFSTTKGSTSVDDDGAAVDDDNSGQTVQGGGGNDTISQNGQNTVQGGGGNDTISQNGQNTVQGGGGNDTISQNGQDTVQGGKGNDTVSQNGQDTVQGGNSQRTSKSGNSGKKTKTEAELAEAGGYKHAQGDNPQYFKDGKKYIYKDGTFTQVKQMYKDGSYTALDGKNYDKNGKEKNEQYYLDQGYFKATNRAGFYGKNGDNNWYKLNSKGNMVKCTMNADGSYTFDGQKYDRHNNKVGKFTKGNNAGTYTSNSGRAASSAPGYNYGVNGNCIALEGKPNQTADADAQWHINGGVYNIKLDVGSAIDKTLDYYDITGQRTTGQNQSHIMVRSDGSLNPDAGMFNGKNKVYFEGTQGKGGKFDNAQILPIYDNNDGGRKILAVKVGNTYYDLQALMQTGKEIIVYPGAVLRQG